MAKRFDIEKTIQWHRDEFPTQFKGLTDGQVVEKIKPFMQEDVDWGAYADPTPQEQKTEMEKQKELLTIY